MRHNQARIIVDRKAGKELERLLADGNKPQKITKRARIVLMTREGYGVIAIRREIGGRRPRSGAGRNSLSKRASKA